MNEVRKNCVHLNGRCSIQATIIIIRKLKRPCKLLSNRISLDMNAYNVVRRKHREKKAYATEYNWNGIRNEQEREKNSIKFLPYLLLLKLQMNGEAPHIIIIGHESWIIYTFPFVCMTLVRLLALAHVLRFLFRKPFCFLVLLVEDFFVKKRARRWLNATESKLHTEKFEKRECTEHDSFLQCGQPMENRKNVKLHSVWRKYHLKWRLPYTSEGIE